MVKKIRREESIKSVRKNLDLPQATVDQLGALAKEEKITVKPYMEKVLIAYAKKYSN